MPSQVVVDSEATAKALLARGQLRQRVTIIPLNKVSTSCTLRCAVPRSAALSLRAALVLPDKAHAACVTSVAHCFP